MPGGPEELLPLADPEGTRQMCLPPPRTTWHQTLLNSWGCREGQGEPVLQPERNRRGRSDFEVMRCPSHLCRRLLGSVARALSSLNPQQSQRALSSASWTPRPLSCTPLRTLGAFKFRRTHLCPRVSPAAIPLLSMAYIYCFFGVGEEEERKRSQAQGPMQSSIYPGLPHGFWWW